MVKRTQPALAGTNNLNLWKCIKAHGWVIGQITHYMVKSKADSPQV